MDLYNNTRAERLENLQERWKVLRVDLKFHKDIDHLTGLDKLVRWIAGKIFIFLHRKESKIIPLEYAKLQGDTFKEIDALDESTFTDKTKYKIRELRRELSIMRVAFEKGIFREDQTWVNYESKLRLIEEALKSKGDLTSKKKAILEKSDETKTETDEGESSDSESHISDSDSNPDLSTMKFEGVLQKANRFSKDTESLEDLYTVKRDGVLLKSSHYNEKTGRIQKSKVRKKKDIEKSRIAEEKKAFLEFEKYQEGFNRMLLGLIKSVDLNTQELVMATIMNNQKVKDLIEKEKEMAKKESRDTLRMNIGQYTSKEDQKIFENYSHSIRTLLAGLELISHKELKDFKESGKFIIDLNDGVLMYSETFTSRDTIKSAQAYKVLALLNQLDGSENILQDNKETIRADIKKIFNDNQDLKVEDMGDAKNQEAIKKIISE